MNIGKNLLLMSISVVLIGLSTESNAYQPIYGNDYANINAYGINENDFKKDNIIQRNGNHTTLNIPKPQGNINLNILGSKRTIELDDDKKLNKRKRYYKIQQRKKAQRMEEQRAFSAAQAAKQEEELRLNNLKAEEKAKKMEDDARINTLNIQKHNQQYQRGNSGGFTPSTPPRGFP